MSADDALLLSSFAGLVGSMLLSVPFIHDTITRWRLWRDFRALEQRPDIPAEIATSLTVNRLKAALANGRWPSFLGSVGWLFLIGALLLLVASQLIRAPGGNG